MKSDAFRAFMEGLIDYAGLFPPARLDLDVAMKDYLRYQEERSSWMLGRFIIPAARLAELELPSRIAVPFSVIVNEIPMDFEPEEAEEIAEEIRAAAARARSMGSGRKSKSPKRK